MCPDPSFSTKKFCLRGGWRLSTSLYLHQNEITLIKTHYLPYDHPRDHIDGQLIPAAHQPSYLSLVLVQDKQNQSVFYQATQSFQDLYKELHPLNPVLFQSHAEIHLAPHRPPKDGYCRVLTSLNRGTLLLPRSTLLYLALHPSLKEGCFSTPSTWVFTLCYTALPRPFESLRVPSRITNALNFFHFRLAFVEFP